MTDNAQPLIQVDPTKMNSPLRAIDAFHIITHFRTVAYLQTTYTSKLSIGDGPGALKVMDQIKEELEVLEKMAIRLIGSVEEGGNNETRP